MPNFIKPDYMNKAVFDKLVQCSTSDTLKFEVLNICAQQKDKAAVKNVFNTFARKHQLEGKIVKLKANETLGHIKDFDGLLNALVEKTGFKRHRLNKIFTALCLDSPGQMQGSIDAFFKALEKESINISRGNTWLFRTTTPEASPFESRKPECLSARLALPSYYKGVRDFIGFDIEKRHLVTVKQPRISDAEYESSEDVWFPGGKTKPLPHCNDCTKLLGLDEVITSPVLLKAIKRKTIRIRA